MSSGFYLVSGFMHINMGCEVMFVLANRMKAQNVDMNTVGSKILCDVTLMMFKKSLIQGMLKMQTPITVPNLYDVFNKFVNSSLMRLDKNSMQKLFYLVLMTFKRQLFLLSNPLELYTLTLTHLQDVAQIQKNNPQATACIEEAIAIFKREAEKITYLLYLDLKQEMLSMFESYKSKIVLFCDNGSQEQNGCLVFQPRNCHNRKNVGLGQNHPSIDFPNQNQWVNRKNIQLSNYTSWKTNLGKDDYDNVRGSSKILQMKPKSKKNLQEDSKQIGDILGIKNLRLDSYEVQIDIFDDSQKKEMKQSKKSENIKIAQTRIDNDIKKKIQKQFDDLAIGDEKKEGDDEIDLLELMDS